VQPRIVLEEPKRRSGRGVWIVLLVALIAVAAYTAYRYWPLLMLPQRAEGDSELEQLQQERRRLAKELGAAREEVATLRGEVVFLQQGAKIDSEACQSVSTSLETLQKENAELRQQVTLYRGIVSPEQGKAGVRVMEFRIAEGAAPQRWRFDLVLTRPLRNERLAKGAIEVQVDGSQDEKKMTLKGNQIFPPDSAPMAYSFKYSQEFSGELVLPEGFLPDEVTVTLVPEGEDAKRGRIQADYDWARLTGPGGE
jgi:hypothetical protein